MLERYQNPVIGSEVRLKLFSYNSNNRANVDSIDRIEIYFLDPAERTDANPTGQRLIETIDGEDVTTEEVGLYSAIVTLDSESYSIGQYVDVWHVTIASESAPIENKFEVYPSLWFTTTTPIIYDFGFSIRPNRLQKGSKRYLVIEIVPNVPGRDQLFSYYQNIAITANLKISIEQHCGECLPCEKDLRLTVDKAAVELREKCFGYYFLNTTDMNQGIYNVWFQLELGENVYISEKEQLQIVE